MPINIFQKGEVFANTALDLLRRNVRTPSLFVNRMGVADFAGAAGDVINIKRPPILKARDKGWRNDLKIQVDKIEQTKIQVKLDQHPYQAVFLTAEEETLDDVSYVRDVQYPQIRAMLEYFEDAVVSTLRSADYKLDVTYDVSSSTEKESDPRKVASRARRLFGENWIPGSGRYWLVGSAVAEAIRDYGKLLDVDTSGLPEAVRDGVVTRLSGFPIIEVDALDSDESYFIHNTALSIVTAAPVIPRGIAHAGHSAAGQGLAITQLWDYDADYLQDRSIVHAFVGATPIVDPVIVDGELQHDSDDEPEMEFVRAIRCDFSE